MVVCLHHISGRLRIRLPAVKESSAAASALSQKISQLAGISSVTVNQRTGSVIICYVPEQIGLADLSVALRRITGSRDGGHADLAAQPQAHALRAPSDGVVEKLLEKVLATLAEKLIERSALGLLGALI